MGIVDVRGTIPFVNYSKDRRGYAPSVIVLHITGDSKPKQALEWFQDPAAGVSSHYIVEKDGTVYYCVDTNYRAYHCGEVKSPTAQIYFDNDRVNPNNYSIGIECVSQGEPLTSSQKLALIQLVLSLTEKYNIPLDRYNIIGHNELDTVTRASDPVASYNPDEIVKALEGFKMFKDSNLIGAYAQDAVNNVAEKGIMKGDTDGNFKPLEPVTRQDLAVAINNLIKFFEK